MGPASTTLWSEAAEAVSRARSSVRWLALNDVIIDRRGPIPPAIRSQYQALACDTICRPERVGNRRGIETRPAQDSGDPVRRCGPPIATMSRRSLDRRWRTWQTRFYL